MTEFICIKLFLLVIFSPCLYGAPHQNEENVDDDPLTHNPDYTEDGLKIHGGDMLYPSDLLNDEDRQAIHENYYSQKDPQCSRWPGGVVLYSRDSSMSDSTFRMLKLAMDLWSTVSCVSFRSVPSDSKQAFVKLLTSSGCFAHVGRICWLDAYNQLGLGRGCAGNIGIPAHELGHALGIYHQQSRSDRDSYVIINYGNIQSGRERNFRKLDPKWSYNYDVAYDYCSVMHYRPYSFTSNGQPTIVHINPNDNRQMGQRSGLSFGDIKLVNRMYNCSKHCSDNLFCDSPCFLNKNCKCTCPGGSGSSCISFTQSSLPPEVAPRTITTTPKPTQPPTTKTTTPKPWQPTSSCDSLITLSIHETKSWSFTDRNQQKQLCTIKIQAESSKKISGTVTFARFPSKRRCRKNYFQINEEGQLDFTGIKKYCQTIRQKRRKKGLTLTSTDSSVFIQMNLGGNRKKIVLRISVTSIDNI